MCCYKVSQCGLLCDILDSLGQNFHHELLRDANQPPSGWRMLTNVHVTDYSLSVTAVFPFSSFSSRISFV